MGAKNMSGRRRQHKLLTKLRKARGCQAWCIAVFNVLLLDYFHEPTMLKDVKWWLNERERNGGTKDFAPDHDTPILVARHSSTYEYEKHVGWSSHIVPQIFQNSVLLGVNFYVTFAVVGNLTAASCFQAVTGVVSALLAFYKIAVVVIPSMKNHIQRQEVRIQQGDIRNTVNQLISIRDKRPLVVFLNWACWRVTSWGPYPTACIRFNIYNSDDPSDETNGTVALMFEIKYGSNRRFTHELHRLQRLQRPEWSGEWPFKKNKEGVRVKADTLESFESHASVNVRYKSIVDLDIRNLA